MHSPGSFTMVKKQAARPASSKAKPSSKSSKKAASHSANHASNGHQQPPSAGHLPLAHQQALLDVFRSTFNSVLSSASFNTTLQEVKTALFRRDFNTAFGNDEYLEAYAARWSPTRALCYASVFARLQVHLAACTFNTAAQNPIGEQLVVGDASPSLPEDFSDAAKHDDNVGATTANQNSTPAATRTLKALAIGGAAAEAVAFGSFLNQQRTQHPEAHPSLSGEITLLDIAPWSNVVASLRTALTTPPTLSKYASAAAHATNAALVAAPHQLRRCSFRQHDVLALRKQDLTSLLFGGDGASQQQQQQQQQQPVLVTLLFTLNELFTAGGIGKTTAFLLTLTSVLSKGSLLLVIDSPGSYSETTVGKEAKRYPMQWLLDKILLEAKDEHDNAEWDKVESADSLWFRLGQDLEYPIPLEDMRYQMHLYRRGGSESGGDAD